MLKAYQASALFLQEHTAALGASHKTTATKSEILHLVKLFKNEALPPAARPCITELIAYVRSDTSGIFPQVDRTHLMEVAASRLTACEQHITDDMRGTQKSQTCEAGHNYLTAEELDLFARSESCTQNKN